MNAGPVFLNGEFVAPDEARIPVMDRGLLFGDSVYEVIPAYGGILFRATEHLQRLDRSLAAIRVKNPLHQAEWLDRLQTLASYYPDQDQHLYIQVTRGTDSQRQHAITKEVRPNYFAFSQPVTLSEQTKDLGIRAITTDDIRWQRCDIKANDLLANVLSYQDAQDQGAQEAIFIHQGHAIEGTASNVFVVFGRQIITPPTGNRLLTGVTRDLVKELAQRHGLLCQEANIKREDLLQADEVWLTSSTREIMPVVQIDKQIIGTGKPGPVWQKMHQFLLQFKSDLRQQKQASNP